MTENKIERVANNPKRELDLNLDYKIKTDHKFDVIVSEVNDLKVNKVEEHFEDEDFDNFEDKAECINTGKNQLHSSPVQDFDLNEDFKIKFEIKEKNSKPNEKSTTTQDNFNKESNSHELQLKI